MELLKEHHHLLAAIKDVAEEAEMKNFVITEVETNGKGEGYMGLFFLITIKDTVTGNKQLQFALKGAFTDEKIRKVVPVQIFFSNEVVFYTKIYKKFQQFENDRKVSQKLELVPRCLKVSLEPSKELLVLENLKLSGFEVLDRKRVLDHEHISLIFQTYGRFHAYSFALRDQKPEEFKELEKSIDNLSQRFKTEETLLKQHIKLCGKLVESYLIPGEDDEIIKIYKKVYANDGIADVFGDLLEGNNCKNKSILHGDCWSNNIMFKYENTSKGKTLAEIRLIDFQLLKIGNPVIDLSYCLYSGTVKENLDKLDEYLQIYYRSFSSFLKELGSDPEKLFPFEALKEDWKKYSKFGMIIGFTVLKNKMTSTEEVVDLSILADGSDSKEIINAKFDEERYKKMVRDLLHHMIEINAL